MEGLEEKLSSIMSDPDTMQKIMAMAQSLGAASPPPKQEAPQAPALPDIDLSMLQKFSGLAQQGTIDQQQRTLLQALRPYLSAERLQKLEKAMRAAKMAKIASFALGQSGR